MLIPQSRFSEILNQLPDTPENVQLRHFLQHRLCKVYADESMDITSAVIIQSDSLPAEPNGLGTNAEMLWALLQQEVVGWDCILVEDQVAPAVALKMASAGIKSKFYRDITLVLAGLALEHSNPHVRLLVPDDLRLLEAAPKELRGAGFKNTEALLRDGVIAAGIIEGKIVSIAHTSAITDMHADVGVFTTQSFRSQGLSTAAVSLVCKELQRRNITPVWSCGESNLASLKVAEKVGFKRHSTKTYVIKLLE